MTVCFLWRQAARAAEPTRPSTLSCKQVQLTFGKVRRGGEGILPAAPIIKTFMMVTVRLKRGEDYRSDIFG